MTEEAQENQELQVYEEIVQEELNESSEAQNSQKPESNSRWRNFRNRSNFIHGLAVGLGIGCISTFIIVWVSLFFAPKLPTGVTYENLLSVFIFPLIYLLAVGLIALTAGIVREYFAAKSTF